MKLTLSLIAILLSVVASNAQSRTITADEYNGNFNGAVYVTNQAFPFIFTVITDTFENGKLLRSKSEINESESEGHERTKTTIAADGKKTNTFQIMTGFGTVYCSDDGVSWKPPTQYQCPGPDKELGLAAPRTPDSAEYSVEQKSVDGKKVNVFRKFAVFASITANGKRGFEEQIATIDSQGLFINVIDTNGILDPKTVTQIQRETWDTKTKFTPVVAPSK